MKKGKVLSAALIIAVIFGMTISWSSLNVEMYDYHHSEAANQMESFPFKAKLPTKIPFEDMKLMNVNIEEDKQQAVITLFNAKKNMIDIKISPHKSEYEQELTKRSVRIGKDITGIFIPEYSGKRILTWKDGQLYYEISYYYKLTKWEVSKQQLVKMAASFK
ncbi:MAG: hypothetical protein H0Z32_01405 [Bacillaceae bacterium]|nr:hypothetical protein [Bacillaceae bacterium]